MHDYQEGHNGDFPSSTRLEIKSSGFLVVHQVYWDRFLMTKTVDSLNATIKGKWEDAGLVGDVSEIGKTIREWADNQKWAFRLIVG
jgi:hypothetical protein